MSRRYQSIFVAFLVIAYSASSLAAKGATAQPAQTLSDPAGLAPLAIGRASQGGRISGAQVPLPGWRRGDSERLRNARRRYRRRCRNAGKPRLFRHSVRIDADGDNGEWVYLRQHKSGLPDAMQYTPVLNTGRNWQIYNGPGFTGAVDIPKDDWFHLRLEVTGAQAKLYVKDMDKPALVMDDLKSGVQKGQIALYVLTGATYFSNFEVRTTPDAPWERTFRRCRRAR